MGFSILVERNKLFWFILWSEQIIYKNGQKANESYSKTSNEKGVKLEDIGKIIKLDMGITSSRIKIKPNNLK